MLKPLLPCVLLIVSFSGCALSKNQLFSRKNDDTVERSISIARLSERHGNVQQARSMYARLASEHPNHPVPHHRLGVLAAKAGNYQEAMQHLSRAQQVGGDTPELLCDIGYLYYLQNNHAAAEQHLRKAISADPQNKRAYNTLGLVLAEEGRFAEALDSFRRAVSEAEALANLAYVQVQLGAFDEAEANYHRALAMNQSLKPAAEGLMHIAAMKGELKPVTPSESREAIVRKTPQRGPQEQPQQSGQLAAAAANVAEVIAESDQTVVRQASHKRAPAEESYELVDPRVGTTSRQIEVAALPQNAAPRKAETRPATANAMDSNTLLPSRSPSWAPYQQPTQPLIP